MGWPFGTSEKDKLATIKATEREKFYKDHITILGAVTKAIPSISLGNSHYNGSELQL